MFTPLTKNGISLLLLLIGSLRAQAQQSVLDKYIREAFINNQGLQQRSLNIDKAIYALKEAKTYYLPAVSFNTTYTLAGGGRTIDLPIGDLLNPIYSTLNQLTASNRFPQIENESVLLNPNNFYDARLHTTLPLINMEIVYNKKIKQQAITKEQAAVNVYKRELVKDIKSAYYHYYQAGKAVAIYKSALKLVEENIRVNESLLKNGATNGTALTRAQTEKQKIEANINEVENKEKNARAYFNFLLNKDLNETVIMDTAVITGSYTGFENIQPVATTEREELQQIKTVQSMQELNTALQKSYLVPKLNTFLDLGSQNYNFKVDDKSMYYFFGINLQWDLFSSGKNTYKIKQAEKDQQVSQALYTETEKGFRLQEEQNKNNLNTAVSNYLSAQKEAALAEKYYNDQYKVYKEGSLLYIELIDAQNQLTAARLRLALAEGDILISKAELERNQATYPLN